jgi:hypothetical protein
LDIEIENKLEPKLFDKYKALRKRLVKEIESYIIKDDKKEKEANTNFKKSFEVNVKASATIVT